MLLSDRVTERGNQGDAKSGERYAAVGSGLLDQIAGAEVFDVKKLSDYRIMTVGDRLKIVLTPEAIRLQKAGCEARYKS
jgi:hypothetical protein